MLAGTVEFSAAVVFSLCEVFLVLVLWFSDDI